MTEMRSLCCSLPHAPNPPQSCRTRVPHTCITPLGTRMVQHITNMVRLFKYFISLLLAFRESKLILFHVPRKSPHQTAFLHSWLNKVTAKILELLLFASKPI